MEENLKSQIHSILNEYCKEFLNVQEITHAANEIINDPTEETILKMTTYLDSFDTYRLGQPSLRPTETTRGLTANNVRFAMSEIRKLIATANESDDTESDNNEEG
jgi:hypothetical protein